MRHADIVRPHATVTGKHGVWVPQKGAGIVLMITMNHGDGATVHYINEEQGNLVEKIYVYMAQLGSFHDVEAIKLFIFLEASYYCLGIFFALPSAEAVFHPLNSFFPRLGISDSIGKCSSTASHEVVRQQQA